MLMLSFCSVQPQPAVGPTSFAGAFSPREDRDKRPVVQATTCVSAEASSALSPCNKVQSSWLCAGTDCQLMVPQTLIQS